MFTTLLVLASIQLAPPTRLQSAGELIDVTVGHAAPYLFDVNQDGLLDLLVGEFGDADFPTERLPKQYADTEPGRYSQGKLRIYLNNGTARHPQYSEFTYLKAGAEDASVPTT